MQNRQLFNKVITGSTAVLLALTLAACGHHDAVTTSSSSSSVRSAKTTYNGSKAYRSANKLIRNENYQAAYNRLNSVDNRSTQEDNLATDLQNYMSARDSYKSGDYATASATLKEQKSTSPAMRDAYSDLQDKVSKAQKESATSNQAISKSSSSKTSASQSSTDQTNDDVVVEFANKMGFSGDKGYQIVQTGKSGNTYKFEVRRSNDDNTVANLVGIYQYNSQSGAVTKLS